MHSDLPNWEELTVISAKECRRGLDNNLYGKYAFYCLVELSLTRWQWVSCKHGWRVNNWCYTYTPTEQKSATTPKPPRILATEATTVSQIGTVCFGMLNKIWERLFEIYGAHTLKSRKRVQKLGWAVHLWGKVINLLESLVKMVAGNNGEPLQSS